MGGIGLPEMIVVLIIALVIFGPKKLPALGEGLGKAISGFKKGMSEGVKEASAEQVQEAAVREKKIEA
jgi:sec-independent protein translocase protein TatA